MRLDSAEYQALIGLLRRQLSASVLRLMAPNVVAGLYCLFGAEALRRREAGGAWSWDMVARALGLNPPLDDGERTDLVVRGLEFWGLPLLRGEDGSRRRLHTLLFQAGLPTPLLARAEFQRFLQAALRDIESFAAAQPGPARLLVDAAARHLPASWQQDITIGLATDFLLALVPVRRALRQGGRVPEGWRDALPIDLSDAAAGRLLDMLLRQPAPVRTEPRELAALCRRVLIRQGDGWVPHLAPAPPGRVPPAFLRQPPFTDRDRPIRVRLSVAGSELALLESERDGGSDWAYKPRSDTVAFDFSRPAAASLLVDGQECGRGDLPGGAAPGGAPWVFEEDAGRGWLALVGQGSRTTAAPQLFVAVDPGRGRFEPRGGSAEPWGSLAGSPRVLHAISGEVLWHEDGEAHPVRLRTGIEQDNPDGLMLTLRYPRWQVAGMAACLGSPQIGAPPRNARILARRPRDGGAWQPAAKVLSEGEVELALVDGDGALLDRQRLAILPADAQITARQIPAGFVVEVAGFGTAPVGLEACPDAERTQAPDGRLRLAVRTRMRVPADVAVVTRLGGRDLRHLVRVRLSRGMLLDRNGTEMHANAQLSFQDLAGLVARGGEVGDPAEVSASLLPESAGLLPARLPGTRLARSLRFAEELPLARLLPELRRMHATAGERDAQVRIAVRLGGVDGTPVHVAPYGAVLRLERGQQRVRLEDGRLPLPESGAGLAAFALARPDHPAIGLDPAEPGWWRLPSGDGPWLLAGSGTLAMQVRPTLFPGTAGPVEGVLAAAAGCPVQDRRAALLAQSLEALGDAPDAPPQQAEWAFLDATLAHGTAVAPPIFFDVLVRAADHPHVLVNWLLRADDAQLARIAALEDGLPFAWALLPMAAWRRAADGFLGRLADFPDIARQALAARLDAIADCCPPARAGVWEAREAAGLPHGPNEFAAASLPPPALLAPFAAPDPGDDAWHEAVAGCRDWENLPPLVHGGAPHFAARCALGLAKAAPRAVSAVRFCRHQAIDQFDSDFRIAHLVLRAGQKGTP